MGLGRQRPAVLTVALLGLQHQGQAVQDLCSVALVLLYQVGAGCRAAPIWYCQAQKRCSPALISRQPWNPLLKSSCKVTPSELKPTSAGSSISTCANRILEETPCMMLMLIWGN